MASRLSGMAAAMARVWALPDHVPLPCHHQGGHREPASASVGMWGWVTIRSSISQFALAFRLNRAGTRHIPQPSTMGSWVVSFTPEGHQVRPIEDQLFHILRVFQGEQQSDVAPVGEAQQVASGNAPPVQELLQILRKLLQGEGGSPSGALPMAPGVHRDDPEVLGKGSHPPLEIGVVLPVAVEEHQRESLPRLYTAQPDVHHSPPLTALCPPGAAR